MTHCDATFRDCTGTGSASARRRLDFQSSSRALADHHINVTWGVNFWWMIIIFLWASRCRQLTSTLHACDRPVSNILSVCARPHFLNSRSNLKILTFHSHFSGCLLDGVPPSAPPDVPPRNPTMSRMNGRVTGNPTELGVDFEPSCLVRTPSGNVYIPSGNLGMSPSTLSRRRRRSRT